MAAVEAKGTNVGGIQEEHTPRPIWQWLVWSFRKMICSLEWFVWLVVTCSSIRRYFIWRALVLFTLGDPSLRGGNGIPLRCVYLEEMAADLDGQDWLDMDNIEQVRCQRVYKPSLDYVKNANRNWSLTDWKMSLF